jgi:hypothetical protein
MRQMNPYCLECEVAAFRNKNFISTEKTCGNDSGNEFYDEKIGLVG